MKKIKQTYLINAPVEKVWEALVDPKVIEKWGAGPAIMNPQEAFEFSLWGGDIHGKNTKIIERKQLIQEWYEKGWEKPSRVTFNLSSKDNKTEIELIHEQIPDSRLKDIDQGWKDYYLGPIKKLLEK